MNKYINTLLLFIISTIGIKSYAGEAVKGALYANRGGEQQVSDSHKALFYPGQKVSVGISGTVDINTRKRSRRKCGFLGLGCKRIHWTEHHYKTPAQMPATFIFKASSGTASPIVLQVSAQQSSVQIPSGEFGQSYQLFGRVGGAGFQVDPGRSSGSYQVKMIVDSNNRLPLLDQYLSQYRAINDLIDNPNIIDIHLREDKPKAVAQRLRNYAKQHYNASEAINREGHLQILELARQLAPAEAANMSALADYYDVVGLPNEAEKQRMIAVRALQEQLSIAPSAELSLDLAQNYMSLGQTILSKDGAITLASNLRADTYFSKAIELLRKTGYQQTLSESLIQRANLLRGLRSVNALELSAKLYSEARKITPFTLKADLILGAKQNNSFWAGQAYQAITLTDAQDLTNTITLSSDKEDISTVGWDQVQQKFLIEKGRSLYWSDPRQGEEGFEYVGAANGGNYETIAKHRIVIDKKDSQSYLATNNDQLHLIELSNQKNCQASINRTLKMPAWTTQPSTQPAEKITGPHLSSLSRNGKFLAVACEQKLQVFSITESDLQPYFSYNYTDDKFSIIGIAISDDGRHLALSVRHFQLPSPSAPAKISEKILALATQQNTTPVLIKVLDDSAMVSSPGIGYGLSRQVQALNQRAVSFVPKQPHIMIPEENVISSYHADNGNLISTLELPKEQVSVWNKGNFFMGGFTPAKPRLLPYWINDQHLMVAKSDNNFMGPDQSSIHLVDWSNQTISTYYVGSKRAPVVGFSGAIHLGKNYLFSKRYQAYLHKYQYKDGKIQLVSDKPIKILLGPNGEPPEHLVESDLVISNGFSSKLKTITNLQTGQVSSIKLESDNPIQIANDGYWYQLQSNNWGAINKLNLFHDDQFNKSINLPPPAIPSIEILTSAIQPLAQQPISAVNNNNSVEVIDSQQEFAEVLANLDRVTALWSSQQMQRAINNKSFSSYLEPWLFYRNDQQKLVPIQLRYPGPKMPLLGIDSNQLSSQNPSKAFNIFSINSPSAGFRPIAVSEQTLWVSKAPNNQVAQLSADNSLTTINTDHINQQSIQHQHIELSTDKNLLLIPAANRSSEAAIAIMKKSNNQYQQLDCPVCKSYQPSALKQKFNQRIPGKHKMLRQQAQKASRASGIITDRDYSLLAFPNPTETIIYDMNTQQERLRINLTEVLYLTPNLIVSRDFGKRIMHVRLLEQ